MIYQWVLSRQEVGGLGQARGMAALWALAGRQHLGIDPLNDGTWALALRADGCSGCLPPHPLLRGSPRWWTLAG